jgi:hypothetical protein
VEVIITSTKIVMKNHIHVLYKNKTRYAEIYTPQRKDGKKINNPVYLGKVIDLEKGIFYSRKRGYFKYTLSDGFETCDFDKTESTQISPEEMDILDFGSAYLLWNILEMMGFLPLLRNLCPKHADSLLALIFYRIQESGGYNMANDWLKGSYTRILFPNAQLTSQRVSELLEIVGDETFFRHFFENYLKIEIPKDRKVGILIDSTGLPNDIDTYLTAVNKHNGVISNETRLLLVVDKQSGKPLFFRYNPGNVPDVSTLQATILELKAMHVDIGMTVVDAGYFSIKNAEELANAGIPYVTRLSSNRKLYKHLIAEYHADALDEKNVVKYGGRLVGIVRVPISLPGDKDGYAYVSVDYERRHQQWTKYTQDAIEDGASIEERREKTHKCGFFILICSERIETTEILKLYYTRQTVEQIFDMSKNDIDLLPLRVHSEKTLRGHLMLVFLAALVYLYLNEILKDTKWNAANAIMIFRNLKCKIYDEEVLVKEPVKNMKEISKKIGITIPKRIVEGKHCGN